MKKKILSVTLILSMLALMACGNTNTSVNDVETPVEAEETVSAEENTQSITEENPNVVDKNEAFENMVTEEVTEEINTENTTEPSMETVTETPTDETSSVKENEVDIKAMPTTYEEIASLPMESYINFFQSIYPDSKCYIESGESVIPYAIDNEQDHLQNVFCCEVGNDVFKICEYDTPENAYIYLNSYIYYSQQECSSNVGGVGIKTWFIGRNVLEERPAVQEVGWLEGNRVIYFYTYDYRTVDEIKTLYYDLFKAAMDN